MRSQQQKSPGRANTSFPCGNKPCCHSNSAWQRRLVVTRLSRRGTWVIASQGERRCAGAGRIPKRGTEPPRKCGSFACQDTKIPRFGQYKRRVRIARRAKTAGVSPVAYLPHCHGYYRKWAMASVLTTTTSSNDCAGNNQPRN